MTHVQPPISAHTQLCAVIGNPVHHSLSPAIHNAAFKATGLDFVYTAFKVEHPAMVLDGMRAMENFRGLSVTIPHKTAIVNLVDEISDLDKTIGSINTVIHQNGKLRGAGTDGPGALRALIDAGTPLADTRLLILGAGGAARAIAFALLDYAQVEELALYDPDTTTLSRLAGDLSSFFTLPVQKIDSHPTLLHYASTANIIINTSPVGMFPNVNNTPLKGAQFSPRQTCFDIIYTPVMTQFLKTAQMQGAKIISGVEMFVHQAAMQFELFTGIPAPVSVMRAIVEERVTQ